MDHWQLLRQFTPARIAQGKSGCGVPTAALLDFQIAHAAARDAVLEPWDTAPLGAALGAMGLATVMLETRVSSRPMYLLRPDLGRCLSEDSRALLLASASSVPPAPVDVAIMVTNGLSSTAVTRHGYGLLEALTDTLTGQGLSIGPVCLVPNGRVALADEIGELLGARLSLMVVGERPGLSAADSLGIYLTFDPRVGRSDADRNCISNIRPPEGLGYGEAAAKTAYLALKALAGGFSGVALKDDMEPSALLPAGKPALADGTAGLAGLPGPDSSA